MKRKDKFTINKSSYAVARNIEKRYLGNRNPLNDTDKYLIPINKLEVGDSIYLRHDENLPYRIINCRISVNRIHKVLGYDMFYMHKTKEPKMLEIGRIR